MSDAPMQHGFIDIPMDHDSAWWWEAVAERRLLLPRCEACERFFFPPQPTCPRCGSSAWTKVESAGTGIVYSWIVVERALHPAFAEDAPYTIVAVELDEGVRLLGRLAPGEDVAADDRLRPRFYSAGGRALLGFEHAAEG